MFLDEASLRNRADQLRSKGAWIYPGFPAKHLDLDPEGLHGANAELSTAEIAAGNVGPSSIEMPRPPPVGDVDVIVRRAGRVGLQVKDLGLLVVQKGGDVNPIYAEARAARSILFDDLRPASSLSTLSKITIGRSPSGQATMTGGHRPSSLPSGLHHVQVNVPFGTYATSARTKMEKAVAKSIDQLDRVPGLTHLVPVISFLRYPVDQTWAFDYAKARLRAQAPYWSRADAVALLFAQPVPTSIPYFFQTQPLLVPMRNPRRRGLDQAILNPNPTVRLHGETGVQWSGTYDEGFQPVLRTVTLENGRLADKGTPLGRVPEGFGFSLLGVAGSLQGPEPFFDMGTFTRRRRK